MFLQKNQTSNRIFSENLDLVLNVSKCTSRQEHFLYAAWGPVETEFVLSTYKTAVGMRKPSIKVGPFTQSVHMLV